MRLQVMHLPAPADEYPFALVIDGCEDPMSLGIVGSHDRGVLAAAESVGARGVLVFQAEVEVA